MRHAKQLIYGIFYLAFWAALIGGIYAWKKPTASCFDGARNQNETGIDCGGVCARVCIPENIAPVEVVGTPRLILLDSPSSTPRASLVAEIRNRNAMFGASNLDYTFQVFDRAGAVIATFPARDYIYASEVKYLVMPNILLPSGVSPAYVKVMFDDPRWTAAARFPRPALSIQVAQAMLANDNIVARGTLVNQDSIAFERVQLIALFRDAAGVLVGVSATELEYVAAGASREFAIFHPPISSAALDKTEVFVTAYNPR